MEYSTLENSGDDQQRTGEEVERKWHFIGRAYVCHKGGFQHQHVSEDDFRSCNGEDMKTKRDQEHEKYLKDKDLELATEKTKEVETRAKGERDMEEQRRQTERDLIEQRRQSEIDLIEQRRQAKREQVEQRRQEKQDDRDKELQDRREQYNRDDMKTKRDQEHEKYLKEMAVEKRKTDEKRAKDERDLVEKRRQAELDIKDKILKIKEKDIQLRKQQNVKNERRSINERLVLKMKHDHEIALKKLEMEQQAKSAKLEERKIKVEENKANNMKDLLAILKPKKQSTNHRANEDRQSEKPQIHINPSTGSFEITTNNDAVPSAINRFLFN